ncbi:N-acetylmuramoyl-L-alanine amidase [Psychrobium sp. MM17-31]|uniref:N-acetylmuramoyl-L-alanine amidase n=1 Tax=Psychrobium sp. MM17-31 TaxID=2917758 RepID=UPI001EF73B94|nr:N-acetylmuramoyl-L-alanine amidase [Psychrobium sp. MM17-31]MCG7530531.1 N-acetylmuramoyl-L-alanine amidase [Psychrobium sp. MM17-31]
MRIALFLIALCFSLTAAAANKLQDVRVWPSPDKFRVVFDLSEKPQFTHFNLTNGHRLVIDFKSTSLKTDLKKLKIKSDLVTRIRTSRPPKKGMLRLVIDLKRGIKPRIFSLPPTGPYGDRLVVDLPKKVVAKTPAKKTTTVVKTSSDKSKQTRDIVIAIDAGHGGEDPGSIGASGRYEKTVTLAISKMLAKRLNDTKGVKAVLTRTGDYYVGLNKRSAIARKASSDLLLSIHADAFTSRKPNGASVLVLSNKRADTEVGRVLEDNERHSELLGGVGEIIESNENSKYLARTLIDMSMEHAKVESYSIASDILHNFSPVTRLHQRKPVLASLAVLKSPDFPSLLIETGFISNVKDEKNLFSTSHRKKLVNAIYNAVIDYFKEKAPEGTYFANYRPKKHTVVRGDSLSMLAKRYKTSVAKIKKHNGMRSNVLRIGQVLKIPQS